ncbi:MAG: GNAT family N-acetyltransferase [Rhizobiaceae bacterium]
MAAPAVRVATVADRDELEALIDACYSVIYPGWYDEELLTDALPAMLRIDERLLESGRYFRANVDGRLAGCGGWSVSAPGGDRRAEGGHIRHFATHPDCMRKGVGSAILARCIAEARAEGLASLKCFSSLPGEAFYARHGFKPVDEVSIMIGGEAAFPALLMERTLA